MFTTFYASLRADQKACDHYKKNHLKSFPKVINFTLKKYRKWYIYCIIKIVIVRPDRSIQFPFRHCPA